MTNEQRKQVIEFLAHSYDIGDDRDNVYSENNAYIEKITESSLSERAELKLVNSTYKLKNLLDDIDKKLRA